LIIDIFFELISLIDERRKGLLLGKDANTRKIRTIEDITALEESCMPRGIK
jgi:hypothetical protein